MSKPVAITGRQQQARTCALSVANHLKKVNTQLASLAHLGEPVAIEIHGAEIRAELATMYDLLTSLPMFEALLPEDTP